MRATLIRVKANELDGLPVADAAQRIKVKRAQQEHARWQAAGLARQPAIYTNTSPTAPTHNATDQHAVFDDESSAGVSDRTRHVIDERCAWFN
ncbi:hypothetical protein BJI47_01045 [Rhodococcus sp. 1168]|nr:hypothetical protein BJI47_01045 [Rhodococcus sp. 1168]